jgi:hypothetical protein
MAGPGGNLPCGGDRPDGHRQLRVAVYLTVVVIVDAA